MKDMDQDCGVNLNSSQVIGPDLALFGSKAFAKQPLPLEFQMTFRYFIGKASTVRSGILAVISNLSQSTWKKTKIHPRRYLNGSNLSTQ